MTEKKTTHPHHMPNIMPGWAMIMIGLLVANITITAINTFKTDSDTLRKIEEIKAGGKENLELMKQIFNSSGYQAQQKDNLQKTLEAFRETPTIEDTTTENTEDLEAMKATFKDMAKDADIVGDKDARFTIYEYSEFHCPYCQRQHNEENIPKAVAQFDGKVNTAYRHFIVHPSAQKFAEIAECVKDQQGIKGFTTYLDKAFKLDGAISDANLDGVLDEMKLDKNKITECIEDGKYTDRVNAQSNEGREFGVSGTPGNLIVDNDTGRYTLVPGAYPSEKFIEEIQKLMDK